MTFFNEENEDAKSGDPSQAALGPRVGFMESFATAWDAQVRTSAQDGMWAAYADEEDKQLRALKEAGIENMPRIGIESWKINDVMNIGPDPDFYRYKEAARFYSGSGDEETGNRMQEYDSRIEELRKQRPDLVLRTAREMYEDTIRKGRDAESKLMSQRRTFGGAVGEFLGGAAASMNPRTDGLNALTLGLGGPGKNAVMRIASETGLQAVVETLNQVTGVQEQREMMDLSSGFGDAFSRVATTAVAGGLFQAAGEGVAYAGKRWFMSSKNDPAPEPPPPGAPLLLEYKPQQPGQNTKIDRSEEFATELALGRGTYNDVLIDALKGHTSRQGRARTILDVDYVASRLEAWDGEAPFQITPKASTALPQRVSPNVAPEIRIDTPGSSLDAIAREVDPKLFNVFDKLADRKAEYRRWLQDPRFKAEQTAAVKKAEATIDDLSTKVENLKRNMDRVGNRRRAEMQVKLDALMEQKAAAVEKLTARDTPEMAAIRKELIATDEKMRDLAPDVTRAYARAKNQWDLGDQERELVRQMVREGRKDLPQSEAPILTDTYENTLQRFVPTLEDKAPILKQSAKVEAMMREGSDAADVAQTIVRENMKVFDEALDAYRASIDGIAKSAQDGVVTINGQQYKFDLDQDTIHVALDDGTGTKRITIRELLEDNADAEAELKATQSCSIL